MHLGGHALGDERRGLHAADVGGDMAGHRIDRARQPAHQNRLAMGNPALAATHRRRRPLCRALANSTASGLRMAVNSSSAHSGSTFGQVDQIERALFPGEVEQHLQPVEDGVGVPVGVVEAVARSGCRGRPGTARGVEARVDADTAQPHHAERVRVTSTRRTGSQKPMVTPMRGGLLQKQTGVDGLPMSPDHR